MRATKLPQSHKFETGLVARLNLVVFFVFAFVFLQRWENTIPLLGLEKREADIAQPQTGFLSANVATLAQGRVERLAECEAVVQAAHVRGLDRGVLPVVGEGG